MSSTETADYKVTVNEGHPPRAGGDAPTWPMCEPVTREIAPYLQDRLIGISYTKF